MSHHSKLPMLLVFQLDMNMRLVNLLLLSGQLNQ